MKKPKERKRKGAPKENEPYPEQRVKLKTEDTKKPAARKSLAMHIVFSI